MNDCYYAKKDWRECKKEVSYNIHQSEHVSGHLKAIESYWRASSAMIIIPPLRSQMNGSNSKQLQLSRSY